MKSESGSQAPDRFPDELYRRPLILSSQTYRAKNKLVHSREAVLDVEVETTDGSGFRPQRFLYDTGAAISAIPMHIAKRAHIPYSREHRVALGGLGSYCHESFLNFVTIRIGGKRVTIPCLIYDHEELTGADQLVAPKGGLLTFITRRVKAVRRRVRRDSGSRIPPAVLGMAGVIDEFNVAIHQSYVIVSDRQSP